MKITRVDRRPGVSYRHFVYGLYKDGVLVYVGVTGNAENRLESHLKSNKDFDEFRLVKGFSSRDRAEQYENLCIKHFDNLLNIVELKPRAVGYHNRYPSITKDDLKRWSN